MALVKYLSFAIILIQFNAYGQGFFERQLDFGYGLYVIQTKDGGYLVSGTTSYFGGFGLTNLFLGKTDALGNVQWYKSYAAVLTEYGYSAIETFDGGYLIAGYTRSSHPSTLADGLLHKVDAMGNTQWTKVYGGAEWDEFRSVVQTDDSNFIALGVTQSFSVLYDIYIVKTDDQGNILWTKAYGDSLNSDNGYHLIKTNDGNYMAAGVTYSFNAGDGFLLKFDNNGSVLWFKTYGGGDIDEIKFVQQANDNGYISAGLTFSYGQGSTDVIIIKTNAAGNVDWAKTYGSSEWDGADAVFQGNNGYFLIAYSDNADYDYYLIKLDMTGVLQWVEPLGHSLIDAVAHASQTLDQGLIMTGRTSNISKFAQQKAWLLKTDTTGSSPCCEGVTDSFIMGIPALNMSDTFMLDTSGGVVSAFGLIEQLESPLDSSLCKPIPLMADFQTDSILCQSLCVQFKDLSAGNPTQWSWEFPGAQPATAVVPDPGNICFNTTGDQNVRLIINDQCSGDTIDKIIRITDCLHYFLPNTFTPNNDGINDILLVRSYGIAAMKLSIYNRLGEKVFESKDVSVGWDGRYKGLLLNQGVFAYHLSGSFINDDKFSELGFITLLK